MSTEDARAQRDLQVLEHNVQQVLMQKQAIQLELNETANALGELAKPNDEVYRIVGNVMVRAEKVSLVKELTEKKHALELRMHTLEKQESLLESKTNELRRQFVASAEEKATKKSKT